MSVDLEEIMLWLRRHKRDGDIWRTPISRRHRQAPNIQTDEDGTRTLNLPLPGLYGRFGVLPDFFTDELLQSDEDDALREFLDIFNHQLLTHLYSLWRDNQLFCADALQSDSEPGKREARYLSKLSGLVGGRTMPNWLLGLRWHKMSVYRARTRTKEGLQTLLHDLFPTLEFQLESFVSVTRLIPADQQVVLGKTPIRLGVQGNLLTGREIADPCGGFRLFFKDLPYDTYMSLLPGGDHRGRLESLVAHYTRGALECLVRLELRAAAVPGWQLGRRRISRDMWVKSKDTPEAVIIEAGQLDVVEES